MAEEIIEFDLFISRQEVNDLYIKREQEIELWTNIQQLLNFELFIRRQEVNELYIKRKEENELCINKLQEHNLFISQKIDFEVER